MYTLTKYKIYLKKIYSSINTEPSKRAECECLAEHGSDAVRFFNASVNRKKHDETIQLYDVTLYT